MSRTLLHDWECSIKKNKNNTEELLKIAEDIYNTAYARGKASEERPKDKWIRTDGNSFECPVCHRLFDFGDNYCGFCGADMRKPNCVTCDHFGDCDGCERSGEE